VVDHPDWKEIDARTRMAGELEPVAAGPGLGPVATGLGPVGEAAYSLAKAESELELNRRRLRFWTDTGWWLKKVLIGALGFWLMRW
jgi:hypothetical protein